MGADFKLDPDFEQGALATTEVRDIVLDAANRAAARARDLAPEDEGDLKESIFAEVELTSNGWQGRVGATDFKAAWKEFGTVRESPSPFLRPAVEEEVGPLEPDTGQDAN